jgi:hypothetical protein
MFLSAWLASSRAQASEKKATSDEKIAVVTMAR